MDLITRFWNMLIDWAEEINEYRRKNDIRAMY